MKLSVGKSMDEIGKIIGIPISEWPGKCHEIADLLLKHKIVDGRLQYGMYCGPISNKSIFAGRVMAHHGWIRNKGTIIDPTRWVFENKEPYIYFVHASHEDYDFGGNRLRMQTMIPCPPFNPKEKVYTLEDPNVSQFLMTLLNNKDEKISVTQLHWIADLDPKILSNFAKDIYQFLKDNELGACVPIDNMNEIMREE